jgi:hypothetical protein
MRAFDPELMFALGESGHSSKLQIPNCQPIFR